MVCHILSRTFDAVVLLTNNVTKIRPSDKCWLLITQLATLTIATQYWPITDAKLCTVRAYWLRRPSCKYYFCM